MSNEPLTEEQIESRRKSAKWMLGFGIASLLFGLYLSAFLVPDVIRSFGGPEPMTLAEAAEVASSDQTYARVEDGAWDCDTLTQVRTRVPSYRRYGSREESSSTEIFYTDADRNVVVFVTLSGTVDCADLDGDVPEGYLYQMSSNTQRELTNDARLARYFDTETFLEFCGYCGRDNSLIGAGFGIAFLVMGVVLIIYSRRYRNVQGDNHESNAI